MNLKDESILELCDVSYGGDLNKMLEIYQQNLKTSHKLCKMESVIIFNQAIEQIERLIDVSN